MENLQSSQSDLEHYVWEFKHLKTNAIYRILALEEAITSRAEFKRRESGFAPSIEVLNDRQYQLFRKKGELECSHHTLCRQNKRFQEQTDGRGKDEKVLEDQNTEIKQQQARMMQSMQTLTQQQRQLEERETALGTQLERTVQDHLHQNERSDASDKILTKKKEALLQRQELLLLLEHTLHQTKDNIEHSRTEIKSEEEKRIQLLEDVSVGSNQASENDSKKSRVEEEAKEWQEKIDRQKFNSHLLGQKHDILSQRRQMLERQNLKKQEEVNKLRHYHEGKLKQNGRIHSNWSKLRQPVSLQTSYSRECLTRFISY